MWKYVMIGIGGFGGAILRFMIRSAAASNHPGQIPLSTLLINLAGCFLLALMMTLFFEEFEINPNIRLGLATGLLGAFTTFCTVCKEILQLMTGGFLGVAGLYIVLSLILGFLSTVFGFSLAEQVIRLRSNRSYKSHDRN